MSQNVMDGRREHAPIVAKSHENEQLRGKLGLKSPG
jgi:hypothetical protein